MMILPSCKHLLCAPNRIPRFFNKLVRTCLLAMCISSFSSNEKNPSESSPPRNTIAVKANKNSTKKYFHDYKLSSLVVTPLKLTTKFGPWQTQGIFVLWLVRSIQKKLTACNFYSFPRSIFVFTCIYLISHFKHC